MAAELPDDATIEQVAEVFGVSDRLDDLTPAARTLTKGDMVAILGVDKPTAAAIQVAAGTLPRPRMLALNAQSEGLDLSVRDIQSIQGVFSGDAFPVEDRVAMLRSVATTLDDPGEAELRSLTIYLCCCPCCCATAVLEPAEQAVA
jgi:hypothetical protein